MNLRVRQKINPKSRNASQEGQPQAVLVHPKREQKFMGEFYVA